MIGSALEYARQLGRTKLIPVLLDPSAQASRRHVEEPTPVDITDMFERATQPLLYYADSVRALRSDLFHQLKVISSNIPTHLECFKFDPQLSGSMGETTKLFKPDEFDFMCVLNEHSDLSLAASQASLNHCHIICQSSNHQLIRLCQHDGAGVSNVHCECLNLNYSKRLDAASFNRAFCDAIEHVLTPQNSDQLNIILKGFDRSQFYLEKHHKFPRLFLTRKGGAFDKLMISIDLVPCLRFNYLK